MKHPVHSYHRKGFEGYRILFKTLEEERDYRRIANSMHKEVSKATVDEHKLNEQADQILGQEQLNQYVLKKSEEFARSHVVFSQLSPSAKSYYDRAVGLLFVAEATGGNFNTEFAHNMQRMAETILQEFSGPAATPFITMDSAIIDRIVSDIRRIAQKGCRTSPPAVGYLTRLLSEPDPHGDELTTLKNAGIQHFVVRSGKYKINEDVVKSWSNSSRLSQPDRFLTAAIDLANMRNTLIHRDPAAWPEDAVPLILSYAIQCPHCGCSVAGTVAISPNLIKNQSGSAVGLQEKQTAQSVKQFEISLGHLVRFIGTGGAVLIPDGVKFIEDGAFENSAISGVRFPLSRAIERIGKYSFRGCRNLQVVILPIGLVEIGDGCFEGCSSLEP